MTRRYCQTCFDMIVLKLVSPLRSLKHMQWKLISQLIACSESKPCEEGVTSNSWDRQKLKNLFCSWYWHVAFLQLRVEAVCCGSLCAMLGKAQHTICVISHPSLNWHIYCKSFGSGTTITYGAHTLSVLLCWWLVIWWSTVITSMFCVNVVPNKSHLKSFSGV